MYSLISRLVVSYPKRLAAIVIGGLLALAVVGGGLFDQLKGGGFDDPDAESTLALQQLEAQFGTGEPNIVIIVEAVDSTIDDPAVQAAVADVEARIGAVDGIDAGDTISYWSTGADQLASVDRNQGLVLARAEGDEDAVEEVFLAVQEATADAPAAISLSYTGQAAVFHQIGVTIEDDMATAEAIAIPLTLILLVIVFAGIRAALLPVLVSVLAIFGSFGVLFLIAKMTDVSVYSLNLVTALGLGLAIDYSLFTVSRFREELGKGYSVPDSITRTIHTAGRTVAFSGLTVAVSLSALLIFPQYFLRSFAYSGIGVILIAMMASVVLLPALLRLMGHRLAPKADRRWGRDDQNLWGRVARVVMRRPVPVTLVVAGVLIVLGAPFLGIKFGVFDDRVLPASDEVRTASDTLREDFPSVESSAFPVVALDSVSEAEASGFAQQLSALDGVSRVDTYNGRYAEGQLVAPPDPSLARYSNGDSAWFSVIPDVEPISPEAERLVADIRALDAGFDFGVGGRSAGLVDSKEAIFSLIPVAAGLVAATTMILLFLLFGSVLVPIKAILLNTLSLTATFGLMVWMFQDGHGSGLLGFTATGLTDTATPILMFCIAFGLSMDYEVFLLSRVKEEYDRIGDNEQAVVIGLARTGRIITAAAVLLSVTFFAFATSGITMIKLFGFGLGVAVLVDAFIVRSTLVPALMKLAGDANWWAPRPLARLQRRIGIKEFSDHELAALTPSVRAGRTPSGRPALDGSATEPQPVGTNVGRD